MPNFELGMLFATPWEFRCLIRQAAILKGFDVIWRKNEGCRIIVECKYSECQWRIYGRWVAKREKWQIINLNKRHKCKRVFRNTQASSQWLADWYLERIRCNPQWKIESLKKTISQELSLDCTYHFVWDVKRRALEVIEGRFKEQYGQLWDYAHAIIKENPLSYVRIKTKREQLDEPNEFYGFFVAYEAMVQGFNDGCRPVVGLDGCFLKGSAYGIVLAACARDANNQMFPIALAVVGSESTSTWTWFLMCFLEALKVDRHDHLVFISDRQKGLLEALRTVVPNATYRYCVRHLYANFYENGFKSLILKKKLWKAACATVIPDFEVAMEELKVLDVKALNG